MNDLNIRITHRDGDHEQTIDIDCGARANHIGVATPAVGAVVTVQRNLAPSLEWSNTLCDGKRVSHAKAEKACAALGAGWRLPTRPELESILDFTRHDPAIDTDRFPGTESSYYWTSTICAWSSYLAWVVHFYYGYVYYYPRTYNHAFVRAVRSVPAGQ